MAVAVQNVAVLAKAGRKNAPLRIALDRWVKVTKAATWTSIRDLREVFPSADGVLVKAAGGVTIVATVFNIKGNEYRVISVVNYSAATVLVCEVLTHAKYSKGQWKDRL